MDVAAHYASRTETVPCLGSCEGWISHRDSLNVVRIAKEVNSISRQDGNLRRSELREPFHKRDVRSLGTIRGDRSRNRLVSRRQAMQLTLSYMWESARRAGEIFWCLAGSRSYSYVLSLKTIAPPLLSRRGPDHSRHPQAESPAWAWGRLGHRVISRLAEKQLTPKAKAAIAELLEPGESLADASLWADENRGRLPKTAPWHYVDVPLDEPRYDAKFSGDVSTKGCVVDKINEFKLTLKDTSKSVEDRRFALRFLVHCVEDMHQPCHVGDNGDKGGNQTQVRFFDRGTNMHALWDSGMIDRVSNTEVSGWLISANWTRRRTVKRR